MIDFISHVLRRVASALISLVALVYLIFIVSEYAPGSFLEIQRAQFGETAEGHESYSLYQKQFEEKHNLQETPWRRASLYIKGFLHNDWEQSYQYPELKTQELVLEKLPVTVGLSLIALGFAALVGVPIGLWAAVRRNSWLDYLLMGTSTLGLAIPSFVLAVGLIYFFAIEFRSFSIGESFPLQFLALPSGGWGDLRHAILPTLALALAPLAGLARYVRTSAIDALAAPHVLTARAKGLPVWKVWLGHILKPALVPVLTVMGTKFSNLLVGTVFVEQIFRVPGLGTLFVQAAIMRDVPLLVSCTVVLVGMVMLFNIIVDLLYVVVDPRLRLE